MKVTNTQVCRVHNPHAMESLTHWCKHIEEQKELTKENQCQGCKDWLYSHSENTSSKNVLKYPSKKGKNPKLKHPSKKRWGQVHTKKQST